MGWTIALWIGACVLALLHLAMLLYLIDVVVRVNEQLAMVLDFQGKTLDAIDRRRR